MKKISLLAVLGVVSVLSDASAAEIPREALGSLPWATVQKAGRKLTLFVMNTSTEGPVWFSSENGMPAPLKEPLNTMSRITQILPSPDGKYLAVESVGEGHPIIAFYSLEAVLKGSSAEPLHEVDPYPGLVRIKEWQGDRLIVESDMLLTHRDGLENRVNSALSLDQFGKFQIQASHWTLTAVDKKLTEPVSYYLERLEKIEAPTPEKVAERLWPIIQLEDAAAVAPLKRLSMKEKDAQVKAKLDQAIENLEGDSFSLEDSSL